MTMVKQNTSSRRLQGNCRGIQVPKFCNGDCFLNTSTRWQQKLRSGIQVSKLAQRKLHSEMCTSTQGKIFFFFFIRVILKKTESRKWDDGIRVIMVPV